MVGLICGLYAILDNAYLGQPLLLISALFLNQFFSWTEENQFSLVPQFAQIWNSTKPNRTEAKKDKNHTTSLI